MEIKVGVKQVTREIVVESSQTAAEVEKAVGTALDKESVLVLTDVHGRKVLIPSASHCHLPPPSALLPEASYRRPQ